MSVPRLSTMHVQKKCMPNFHLINGKSCLLFAEAVFLNDSNLAFANKLLVESDTNMQFFLVERELFPVSQGLTTGFMSGVPDVCERSKNCAQFVVTVACAGTEINSF